MKHSMNFTVGSQDVDYRDIIKPSVLVRMMQETADSHLLAQGSDYTAMHDEQGLAFVITRMTVEIYEDIRKRDEITVRTWYSEGKAANFPRSYDVVVNDRVAARAYGNWGLIDLKNEKFVRFKEHNFSPDALEDMVELEMPERFRIPKDIELTAALDMTVTYSQTDVNGHMNNVYYVDPMWDSIPDVSDRRVRSLSIRYVHETLLGEHLTVSRSDIIEEDGRNAIYFRMESSGVTRAEGRWTIE